MVSSNSTHCWVNVRGGEEKKKGRKEEGEREKMKMKEIRLRGGKGGQRSREGRRHQMAGVG